MSCDNCSHVRTSYYAYEGQGTYCSRCGKKLKISKPHRWFLRNLLPIMVMIVGMCGIAALIFGSLELHNRDKARKASYAQILPQGAWRNFYLKGIEISGGNESCDSALTSLIINVKDLPLLNQDQVNVILNNLRWMNKTSVWTELTYREAKK